MPGSKISNAPQNNSFAASFMHLKLRREGKEDCVEARGGGWGDNRIINKLKLHFYGHCHTLVVWYLKLQVQICFGGLF